MESRKIPTHGDFAMSTALHSVVLKEKRSPFKQCKKYLMGHVLFLKSLKGLFSL